MLPNIQKESDGSWLEEEREWSDVFCIFSEFLKQKGKQLNFEEHSLFQGPDQMMLVWFCQQAVGTWTSAHSPMIQSWLGWTSVMPVVGVSLCVPLLGQRPDDRGLINMIKGLFLSHGEVGDEGDLGSKRQVSLISEGLSYHSVIF